MEVQEVKGIKLNPHASLGGQSATDQFFYSPCRMQKIMQGQLVGARQVHIYIIYFFVLIIKRKLLIS
ncbi:hypothetical protein JHK82_035556 [Glycine max]|uniref:Uncharacterized protein n=2 Tax=Glycine subgen. Soja TaxID=1462606 RepID=A0A0R0GUP7_SOYBN|nr:hypothetical protein JHK87_035484 [Glycine soja]KAG4969857.1 hypothetical protein JHK85_036278 [Glycine max]KAG4976214.1 hypothetical protein JHK86_035688 [Glycine max]KAG5112287.1 hypothetical protein JHK82_035556 [Glycine max]KAG5129566.1 hypothetical protein JHK84_035963 [Glycine max]